MYQISFNESAENAFITFNVFLVFITPEALPLIYILKPLEEEGGIRCCYISMDTFIWR